ncbi:hypothetical protein SAMN05443247_02904 [Bradyrhizobium erythrophlei]|jgi:hypothetical protein|nr:hypothetical protein SAMN05443247_02904 [Bradyrhizobium erythrophlei]
MRKLILISAFALASVSAHASESRDMTLATNNETRAVETAKPEQTTAQHINADVKTDAAKPEGSKHHASRQAGKSHMRGYEADEAKARRIAAHYGVYW